MYEHFGFRGERICYEGYYEEFRHLTRSCGAIPSRFTSETHRETRDRISKSKSAKFQSLSLRNFKFIHQVSHQRIMILKYSYKKIFAYFITFPFYFYLTFSDLHFS